MHSSRSARWRCPSSTSGRTSASRRARPESLRPTNRIALMALRFAKMQGQGNDFVVIDGARQSIDITPERARRVAALHFGIGCPEILLVEPAQSAGNDFRYRIWNADGGEVEQCGNGARCFVKFVRDRGYTQAQRIRVEPGRGSIRL